ncbi:MAG: ribosome small subunit-dependent GTPase A [Verrucomicrobia bacterium]|nr:ribosome small subunit-dependent GTPase A [Verrucomicrobiota bacterium]|tara:strand:+ start:102 stop:1046 length:945 start_codon:yes stop_codon:yes gene_type:complete
MEKLQGLVVKSTGSWYEIETAEGKRLQARLKGKFRTAGIKSTNPIAVGDRVHFHMEGEEAMIEKIEGRKNYIMRKSINLSKQTQIIAANIDQVFLLITLESPVTTMAFVDRFLVAAESFRIPVVLVYNKMDLIKQQSQEEVLQLWWDTYAKTIYPQLKISVKEQQGLEQIKDAMKGKTSIFSGHSGVGKSSLINAIDPNLRLMVNEISTYHQSGKHTTTFAELFNLPFGGNIIDTPGIKGFGNVEMEKEEIAHYFPEMRQRMQACKYNNCVHINEPNCAVKEAVVNEEIALSRYENYLSIFEEDKEEQFRKKGY